MPRMNILNTVEQDAFESPPLFNAAQRKLYFDFPTALRQMAVSLRKPCHELGFLLSCGYFSATKRFFAPNRYLPPDIAFVAQQLDLSDTDFNADDYSDRSCQRHQHLILKYYGFRAFDPPARDFIADEIAAMVRSQLKPRLILG